MICNEHTSADDVSPLVTFGAVGLAPGLAALIGDRPTAMALGLPASEVTQTMIAFARERCAQAIVNMGERMKVAVLDEREPHERWWIAAGAQHPNCRGRWLRLNGADPSALMQFLVQVKMQIEPA